MTKTKAFQKVDGIANLYHRDGKYYARLSEGGKRSWRSLDTTKKSDAKKALALLQTGRPLDIKQREEPTLHAAMETAIAHRRSRRGIGKPLSEATLSYHAELLTTAKRIFPDHRLSSFTEAGLLKAIAAARTQKQKGKPARPFGQSRRKAQAELVRQAYRIAIEKGQARSNPLATVELNQPDPKDRRLPTRKELETICTKAIEQNPRHGIAVSMTIKFLAFSGLRVGEARGLTWERIRGDAIHVIEQENGKPLKTRRSKRKIPINPPLQETLEAIAAAYGTDGRVLPLRCVRHQLRTACEALGIQTLTNHDLRSWYATWLIQSGVDIATTSKWLGDDPEVVLRRYAAVTDEHEKQEAGKLR